MFSMYKYISTFTLRVYYTLKTERETHFFEDLAPRGYVVRPRTIGYNEDETRMLFKRLGEYHAASLIYTELVNICKCFLL